MLGKRGQQWPGGSQLGSLGSWGHHWPSHQKQGGRVREQVWNHRQQTQDTGYMEDEEPLRTLENRAT